MAPASGVLRGNWRVIACSFIACLSIIASGSVLSYPSPAVPNINSNLNPFYVDSQEESWIGGCVALGATFGGFVAGALMDYFGRKLTLMLTALPFAVGWVIVVASPNVQTMYAGRFVGGISLGVASGVAHVYIAEISPARLRGALCSLGETFFSLGMCYVYMFGFFLDWQWLCVVCLAEVCLYSLLLCWVPETPRWLVSRAQTERSKEVLQWLRGAHVDISAELREIEQSVKDNKKVARWQDFLHKEHLINMGICLGLFTVQQMCGSAVIKMYTVTLFQDAGTSIDPYIETIIVGVVSFFGCLTCVLVIDILGRRFLLIESTALVSVSMIMLGAFFQVKYNDPEYAMNHLGWIPLFSLMLNCYSFGTGVGTIPWVLPSELFPTEYRGKSNAVGVAWAQFCTFLSTKFFVNLTDAIGMAGGFWVCAGFAIVGCVFSIFAAPETMKKTLEELQLEMTEKNQKDLQQD